ncbi:MAG: type II toxin-antitoxin system VapC family toxin, partial [Chloroflexota bacterium]
IDLVRINDRVLNQAGTMLPADVRSFDAIHMATAALLGDDVRDLVTYDERMASAARSLGCRVSSPT